MKDLSWMESSSHAARIARRPRCPGSRPIWGDLALFNRTSSRVLGMTALVLLWAIGPSVSQAAAQASVTTYHNDNNRTGWNHNETILTPTKVSSLSFGLLYNVPLDDQVDAAPLVVSGVNITAGKFQGVHNVVYIATENNSVYAIGVNSGNVFLKTNLGTPVHVPLGCNNNGPNVGINSTPVIDPVANTLYVIAYTQDASGPAYRLHALDLGNLTDKIPPQLITASHTLSNGSTFTFNATYQRQRPGLLLANGNVYAGFGSFCDLGANMSRGWLLGWNAASLTPLPANQVFDQQASSPKSFFLSSVWMAGYGPATDDEGNILFVTGNSDPSGTTYDGVTNLQESVIKLNPTLTTVLDLFTPSNQATLDEHDNDFGSGGVLVLPDQPGSTPHIAVAGGKDGNLYLLNVDNLGGYSTTQNKVLATYSEGACWCGHSYYIDPIDGLGRVVTSAGRRAKVYKVNTSPAPSLILQATSPTLLGGQDPGFFTTISSNGEVNPIVWALSRSVTTDPSFPIYLYAFNPRSGGSTMVQLFQAVAGTWPSRNADANLLPVVANGHVFVATYKELEVFGMIPNAGAAHAAASKRARP